MQNQSPISLERKSPLLLTGILLEIIKNFFKLEEGKFKYDPIDPVASKLIIEPAYLFTPDNCQNRPGIFVRREPLGYFKPRVGIDDAYSYNPIENSKGDLIEYAIMGDIAFSVLCVGKEPGEVEQLAAKATDVLIYYSPIIRREFIFKIFRVQEIGALSQLEEHKEFWMTPISLYATFSENWTIKQAAPPLNEILFTSKC